MHCMVLNAFIDYHEAIRDTFDGGHFSIMATSVFRAVQVFGFQK